MSFHNKLRGYDLHNSRIQFYEGNPNGSVEAFSEEEMCIDITNKAVYTSISPGFNNWVVVGGSGDISTIGALTDVDTSDRIDETILEWDEASSNYIHIPDMQGKSASIKGGTPTFTDNGDGSVTIGPSIAVLYDNVNNYEKPANYEIASDTFTLVNDLTNYIVVDYNLGTPIYKNITNVELIQESNVIPVYTAFRNDNDIYRISWDSIADGMSNKLHMRFVKTDRFGWEYGIALSENPERIIETTAGKVWYGAVRTDIPSFSSSTDLWSFWYHMGGEWIEDKTTTQYNNTQYDDGTDLVTAGNNTYIVNWIFRCSCDPARGAYVLGNDDFASIAEAKESVVPELPSILNSIQFLVGRVIVEKNATSGIIETAFRESFTSSAVTIHNNLAELNDGDFQHLTQTEYYNSAPKYAEKTADYTLLATDYTIGVTCSTAPINLTLLLSADIPNKIYNIKKLDDTGYVVNLLTTGGELIDGEATITISGQYNSITIQSTQTGWIII